MRLWILAGALIVATGAPAATLHVPAEHATIQAAVDAAASGDSVLVAPGTYTEWEDRQFQAGGVYTASAILFMKPGISVIGEAGSAFTTLDLLGQGTGDVVLCVMIEGQQGAPMLVQGFRITGAPPGFSGMRCRVSDELVVKDCVFDSLDGTAGERPGGLSIISSDPVALLGCRFVDCAGGDLPHLFGGIRASDTNILVEDTTFERCTGGAAYTGSPSYGPTATFRRCTFLDNEGHFGGGLHAGGPQVRIEDCWFEGNSAVAGSAAEVSGVTYLTMERNVVVSNFASEASAGFLVGSSSGSIRNNTFYGNTNVVALGGASLRIHFNSGPIDLWNNVFSGARGGQSVHVNFNAVTSSCNVFWDNPEGDANIYYPWDPSDTIQDPRFCDPEAGNLTLDHFSPCLPENSAGCGLIGALEEGCGSVSVTPQSWGRIKGAYR